MMTTASNTGFVRAATLFVGFLSILVLIGWVFDVQALKSVFPQLATMKANTAISLGLTAVAIWLSRTALLRSKNWLPVWLLCFVVIFIATVTLSEYIWNWNAGIDELLFHDLEHRNTLYPAGRLAPVTAICLLIFSAAILVLDRLERTSHALTLCAGLAPLTSLIGYLYDLPSIYQGNLYTSLAVHTTVGFVSLAIGLLACRPERGIASLLMVSVQRRSNVHLLVAGALLLPVTIGSLTLWGQRHEWYGAEFMIVLFTVLLMVLSVGLVWITGIERQHVEGQRLQAEQELQQLNLELDGRVQQRTEELHQANRELESFSYSVSHDLRAPLRSIENFSGFLLEDHAAHLDGEGRSHLERIRANTERMKQLIADLLAFSQASRTELQRESVPISSLALSVVEELQTRFPDRKVEVHIAPNLRVEADPRLLRVVLENLLGNAWKFTSKTSAAQITFGKLGGDSEVFFVRDNGAGFDMSHAGKLFTAFRRLHGAKDFEGTGIGLATVDRIIRRHNGRIWADGQVEQGASFFFTLGE